MPDITIGPKIQKAGGGDTLTVASGGKFFVENGATFVLNASAVDGAAAQNSFVKTITAIPDVTPTTVLTFTVPNAAHAALIPINILASLGAGGAIGAFEASAVAFGYIVVTRTPGVAAVATAIALSNAGTSAVAGAATITLAYAVTAMVGAVGVPQTFTVTVAITKGSGGSAAHQAIVSVDMINANASGITVA